ncbi:MAG TPA: carboxypeptidase-like regulatory domain-containing protein [Candidatus Limnocylindrales bacterium]|nr:carboxypeptidase-like regulatory domain-containing protein [Candidatus Limnocylindrales bacterium]
MSVISRINDLIRKSPCGSFRSVSVVGGIAVWASLAALLCALPAKGQSPQAPTGNGSEQGRSAAASPLPSSPEGRLPDLPVMGTIHGTIVDPNGTAIAGARVRLTRQVESANPETQSGEDGQYSFAGVAPGPFQLSITAEGFAAKTSAGDLHSGENLAVPSITLALTTEITEVRVELSPIELAQEQMKDEEKQRVLGFIPNFYVTYVPNAAPLNTRQKFELAWKSTVDPVTFGITGAIAGIQQANNQFSGYGQGAQGYAKRYGASYTDIVTNTFIGGAILPSLFKQDPRYFYRGTGSKRSRFFYAIANSVICKGDNGHWQANYSAILGGLAAGGISNLYYPASDRGAGLTFENAAIGIGATAAANILQEFVIRRLTSHVPSSALATP